MTQTAADIRDEINRAETRLASLDGWIASLEAERRRLLAELPPPDADTPAARRHRLAVEQCERGWDRQGGEELAAGAEVERARLLAEQAGHEPLVADVIAAGLRAGEPGLTESRIERARLADRIEVLREQLPSPEQVRKAEAKAEALAATATEAAGEHIDSWVLVVSALSELLPAVAQLSGARRQRAGAVQQRRTLAEQYGLDLPALELPAVSDAETRAARRVVVAVQQVLDGGDMRDVPERELTALIEAARARLEQAEAEGEEVPGLFENDAEAAA